MATRTIEVELTGTSPLLMHRYPLEPQEHIEKKPPEEQAEIAAYRDPDTRELYVPGVAVQSALVGAAAYSKGKGRATLQKQAAACLLVSPERIGLGTKSYKIDTRPVVIQATRGRIPRHRPRLDSWSIRFTLEYDPDLLTAPQVRTIVDDMGKRVGILDFRPARKGPFGRSVVTSWKVASEDSE